MLNMRQLVTSGACLVLLACLLPLGQTHEGGHDHDHGVSGHQHEEATPVTADQLVVLSHLVRRAASQEGGHAHHHHHHHHHHAEHGGTELSVASLLAGLEGTQTVPNDQLQVIVSKLLACAQDPHCTITEAEANHEHDHQDKGSTNGYGSAAKWIVWLQPALGGTVTGSTKAMAAACLFVETIIGLLLPLMLKRVRQHSWWLSLLNTFAGGIFLAAGLMHLIPHSEEAQMGIDLTKWGLPGHYPLYLLLICMGYLLVFMVERVVFEGHDHGHGHSHDAHEDEAVHIHNHTCSHDTHSHAASTSPVKEGQQMRQRRGQRSSDTSPGGEASHTHKEGEEHHHHHHESEFKMVRGLPLLIGMSVHTALECLALGLITRHSSFVVLFAAIAAHKGISAMALSAKFVKEGANMKQVFMLVGPFTLIAPSFIALGDKAGAVFPPAVQLLLGCLAAGTFLYVGASEILAEEFEGDTRAGRRDISKTMSRFIKFGAVLAGVACIAVLGLMPHEH